MVGKSRKVRKGSAILVENIFMKNILIRILSTLFQSIDAFLCKLQLKRPTVIIFVDGGICSQMLRYIHGQYYAEYGMNVYYDDYWFKTNGRDQFGNLPRSFELTEMWPELRYKGISKWKRKLYLIFFKVNRTKEEWLPDPKAIQHSIYLNGYWELSKDIYNMLFSKHFNLQRVKRLDEYIKLENQTIVGIHVRRGDLANGDNPYYGGVTDGYFLRVVDYCSQKFAPKKYIFFSDEPDWVEHNICNKIQQPYEIIRGNKAWEDLCLLSQCSIIVASQGSFGKFAARINKDAILIQCDNQYAIRDREKTYFIQ